MKKFDQVAALLLLEDPMLQIGLHPQAMDAEILMRKLALSLREALDFINQYKVDEPATPPQKWYHTDWYDGPFMSYGRPSGMDHDHLIEIMIDRRAWYWLPEDTKSGEWGGEVHIRIEKENLQRMIDLLDGKEPPDVI